MHQSGHSRAHSMQTDRKSTRLNSSHPSISYAVFCLKKKKLALPASQQQRNSSTSRARNSLRASHNRSASRSISLVDAYSPASTVFFFNDTATTEIYTLSLHDALPI